MIYSELTRKAMNICYMAHHGQTDKSGVPYVFHPYHLAEQMDTEEEICTALLHDVLEDTPLTLAELQKLGMPDSVLDAVWRLTHQKNVPYLEYIVSLRHHPIARKVKLADLRHNSDLSRLTKATREELKRKRKYQAAEAILLRDTYDEKTELYRKQIPLDLRIPRQYVLDVFYDKERTVKRYEVEKLHGEKERLTRENFPVHYIFSSETGDKLKEQFGTSLPEGLGTYLAEYGESEFIRFLQRVQERENYVNDVNK